MCFPRLSLRKTYYLQCLKNSHCFVVGEKKQTLFSYSPIDLLFWRQIRNFETLLSTHLPGISWKRYHWLPVSSGIVSIEWVYTPSTFYMKLALAINGAAEYNLRTSSQYFSFAIDRLVTLDLVALVAVYNPTRAAYCLSPPTYWKISGLSKKDT